MRPLIKDGYEISTDRSKLDIPFIHQYLSTASYWAQHIPIELVKKSIEGSVCFGLYDSLQKFFNCLMAQMGRKMWSLPILQHLACKIEII